MDEVFRALADPSRRRLLDSLNARNGQTLRELCAELDMARQSVSKHLAVLESANLITTRRSGREKLHYLNAEPINAIADRWITRYHRARVHALADLKQALEANPMSERSEQKIDTAGNAFVYTTYIKTTPQRLWQALTDPAFTNRYWGASFDTDWQPGSEMVWHQRDWTSKDPEQIVLESDPYTKLSYTWHTFDPTFATTFDMDPEDVAVWAREPRSKVTFELEPHGETVKLTVIHDGFEPGSAVLAGISGGWPSILSSLKSLLETGESLPEPVA
ncbi:ArsR/SmtB family transcription factor [Nocardia sp. NPDC050408]|uniref:ArsR/SmtB family transcription factor n=1 Tax=unclassified Nocardia TaxID=2637762 RepID=UPI00343BC94D